MSGRRLILRTACAVASGLAVANLGAFFARPAATRPDVAEPATAWERWLALSGEERQLCVRQYEELIRRPDADAVLRNVREFAQLPADGQRRLREALVLLRETVARQPPGRRRELLTTVGATRAFLVYQVLMTEEPQRVAELRAAWTEP